MKNTILAIGIISLFVIGGFIPASASVSKSISEKSEIQTNQIPMTLREQEKIIWVNPNPQNEYEVAYMTGENGPEPLPITPFGLFFKWYKERAYNLNNVCLFYTCARGFFFFRGSLPTVVIDLSYTKIEPLAWSWHRTSFDRDHWGSDEAGHVLATATFNSILQGDITQWASVTCFPDGSYDSDGDTY